MKTLRRNPTTKGKAPSRRTFVAQMAAVAGALAVAEGCGKGDVEAFLQHGFRELSPEEITSVIRRHELDAKARYKKEIRIGNEPAIQGVVFAYALDLSRCVGCRRCAHACAKENNASKDPAIQWIRVLQMDKDEGVNIDHADPYYDPKEVPEEGHFYMPVQCHQCRNAPCVKVCPVGATWQEKDGIVVIDYDWCIGCRFCMAACPYGARRFNWSQPELPADEINPDTHMLGNRPRPKGVVEKCTFCIQRVRKGQYPACVEICPTGSRKFGNLLDPKSEIRYLLEHKRVFIFKEELNTKPKFFYFYGV